MLLPFSSVSHCASKLEKEEILSGSLGKAPVCPILACCFLQRWSLGLQRKLHHFPGSSLNLMLGCSNPRKCWSTHLLLILQRLGCCRWCSLHWMGWVSCLQSAWPFSFLLHELMLALDFVERVWVCFVILMGVSLGFLVWSSPIWHAQFNASGSSGTNKPDRWERGCSYQSA